MKAFKTILASFIIATLSVAPVFALEISTDTEYQLAQEEVVNDNLFIGAENANVAGNVIGDLLAAAGNLVISGDISEDALVFGGAIKMMGEIGEDFRGAGGDIFIGEDVNGDVMAATGVLHISSDVTVAGDVIAAAGQLIIDGTVNGKVFVGVGQLNLNGTVNGDVTVYSDALVMGPGAEVKGDLNYWAREELEQDGSFSVGGEVVFHQSDMPSEGEFGAAIGGLVGGFFIMKLFMCLVAALAIVLFFKKRPLALVKQVSESFWQEFVRGFIYLVIVPFVIILLFMSMVGSMIGIFAGLFYVLTIMLARVIAGIALGSIIYKWVKKSKKIEITWHSALVGVALIHVIGWVPVFGWMISFVLMTSALGAVLHMLHKDIWLNR